jgi:hypothetical protein
VAIESQGRLVTGAARLFLLGLIPMAVMTVPVLLILGQLSLWYQQRPLPVGAEAIVTMQLAPDADSRFPEVSLKPTDAVQTLVGPVRIQSKREVCWNIKVREAGQHRLAFQVGGETFDKELAVGDGFMRVSARRPEWAWLDALEYPDERPFLPGSAVRSIEISYPQRDSWIYGTDWWVVYWFAVSLVAGFCFRRALNVNV